MKAGTISKLKFKALQRRLGESLRGTVGLLETLWLGVASNCPHGDIGKFTNEEIAIIADWQHDPDELVETLVDTGWLDRHPKYRLVVHDWSQHAPNYVKGIVARSEDNFADLEDNFTDLDDEKTNPGHATQGSLPRVANPECGTQGMPPPSLAYSSLFYSSQAKPSDFCSEPDEPASEPEPVFVFPVVGDTDIKTWNLYQSQIDRYQELYPDLDVMVQCRLALAWCEANQPKRKTPRGMTRFLNGWLERAQNNGRAGSDKPKHRETAEEMAQRIMSKGKQP